MRVVLISKTDGPLPVISEEGGGLATTLTMDEPFEIDNPDMNLVLIGAKPSMEQEIEDARQDMEQAKQIIAQWRENRPRPKSVEDAPVGVEVKITNVGANPIRALLDSNVNEFIIDPGSIFEAIAQEYIELREQGV